MKSNQQPRRSGGISRRQILGGALAGAGALAIPGLVGPGVAGALGATPRRRPAPTRRTMTTSTEVEVFSWWTGGGEAAGLEAMIAIFNERHPDIDFINAAIAGGAGSNARPVLEQRLADGDPPDSFQGHAGAELSDYVANGTIEPLSDFFAEQGLGDVFPAQLIEQISFDGDPYSVPVNIHRSNVLWYSPAVLDEAGVGDVPTTLDAWIEALDAVKGSGRTALTMADQWTTEHLMETVLLSALGREGWGALWTADGDWTADDVTTALESFKTVVSYVNDDYASLVWQDASALVSDGEAGFNVMGDWAAGLFIENEKEAETDYNWAAVPGTDGVYQWLSDSFTLPVGAPHPDAALLWLELCGSKEGQDAFNPLKGSIPARTDADSSLYTGYLAWALEQWASSELAGSLAHGVVANNAWKSEVDAAVGLFLQDQDVAAFQDALSLAHDTHAV